MPDYLAAWDIDKGFDPVRYSAPVYGDDRHTAWWCFVEWDESLGLWRAQVKTYRDTTAIRMIVVAEAFRPSAPQGKAWCANWIMRGQMNDDRLQGTEIPTEWTLNHGANRRPLEVGMEIRYKAGGPAFPILKVGTAGALVRGPGRLVQIAGKSINSNGPPTQISLYSEVEYRRRQKARGEWEGIDEHGTAVVDYDLDADNNQEQGDSIMAKDGNGKVKIAGTPTGKGASAPATKSAKAAKAPKEKKEKVVKEQLPCICGCGQLTGSYFVPGHDARFKGWLKKIAAGKATVKELLTPQLAKNLGPWTAKGEGQVPAKDYKDLPRG